MDKLPTDILEFHILNYLSGDDIIKLSKVNKEMRLRLNQFQVLSSVNCKSVWPILDLTSTTACNKDSASRLSDITLTFTQIIINSDLFCQIYNSLPKSNALTLYITNVNEFRELQCALGASKVTELVIDCQSNLTQPQLDILLKEINRYPSLKTVNFSCFQYDYTELASRQLAESKLTTLSLTNLDKSAIQRYAQVLPNSLIKNITVGITSCVHECDFAQEQDEEISIETAYKVLANLETFGGCISKKLLDHVLCLLSTLSLQRIDLPFQLQDESLEILINNLSKSKLKALSIVPHQQINRLMESIQKSKIVHLALNSIDSSSTCRTLSNHLPHIKLESLALTGKFSNIDLDLIFTNLTVPEVELDGWITDAKADSLEFHLQTKSFRNLRLNLKTFGANGFQYVVPIVRDVDVHSLEVYWNDDSLARLSSFILSVGCKVRSLKVKHWPGVNADLGVLLARKHPKLSVEFLEI
ncbi:hypothetical protein HDV04_004645 [Boothiomyces sp. JEL0838]|nr:hypothetical protein HDV04_004629 [Boothiomyces sp. JEL0838]KAJ3310780.1 hypothetical protein HDV04_004645 [Boothiomyces sp. JEL0838]